MQPLALTACLAVLLPCLALARPVSYPGGVTIMQMTDVDAHSLHLHQSPTARYSLGYRGIYWRDTDVQFHGVQLNQLVKRWNKPASQANIYLKSGIGLMVDDTQDMAAFTGFSADWEDRRYFTYYEARFFAAESMDGAFTQKARVGIAPYIGDYGDLHTWLMLQVDHDHEKDDPITLTPLIRLFKSEYLAEIGLNEDGKVLFNFIVRL